MQGYNTIVIFDAEAKNILFCYRVTPPYKDRLNFVGGKIEEQEDGFQAAYRELYEETGITQKDVTLYHLMDFTYHVHDFYMEVYVGRLQKKTVNLVAEKHPLRWISREENFYDTDRFAGDGNIGHIVRVAKQYGYGIEDRKPDNVGNCLQYNGKYVGIDGCKGGWIAAVLDERGLRVEKYPTLDQLVLKHADFSECLIDMVVGLPESDKEVRPDTYARRIIPQRASTIFPAPCRQAVYAAAVAEKYELNEQILGKKFTPLTLGIMPKMREVDEFLDNNPEYKNILKESHPEVCFARLSGATVLTKKTESDGVEERLSILNKFLFIDQNYLLDKKKVFRCSMDDLLDAVCLAVTAALIREGKTECIPTSPMKDVRGLYMQMIIPKL